MLNLHVWALGMLSEKQLQCNDAYHRVVDLLDRVQQQRQWLTES